MQEDVSESATSIKPRCCIRSTDPGLESFHTTLTGQRLNQLRTISYAAWWFSCMGYSVMYAIAFAMDLLAPEEFLSILTYVCMGGSAEVDLLFP